jgi:uncharacterized glyoxalase superfamily protein PhnB
VAVSSFCIFVFLGLRGNSGIRHERDADLYLHGEDGLQRLTDYNCSFVFQNRRLCLVNSRRVPGGNAALRVDGHSEVKGQAREPQRVFITFAVDDAVEEQKRLEAAGVRFVRPATREPWGGLVATFMDLDGNYCQLVDTVARVYI